MRGVRSCFLIVAGVVGLVAAPSSAGAQVLQTPHDHIPNFAASPTIRSATHGSWSSPSTWTPARVPTASDVVSVAHTVVYDAIAGDADVIGIVSGGVLRFATTQNTRLAVGVLMVLSNGTLEVGTVSNPVPPNVTVEIVIKDKPLNLSTDPEQFGTGLLSVDGIVRMQGARKSPTFIRTSVEPRAGNTTVTLEQPAVEWEIGDRVFLPDTRQVPNDRWFDQSWPLQVETRSIQNISADGRTVTLSSALSFDHRGARDADGTATVLPSGIRLLPHVGNLTRNIVIRSENPAGTRGHTLYTQRSDVRIAYVQFQDLGRTKAEPLDSNTNKIGRYPLHIHHMWGLVNPTNTGYQFELVGNTVNDSRKWPIAIHGSHYGLIQQNVVFGGSQLTGAGIAVEDGTEAENLFEGNFVANVRGHAPPRQSGPNTADGTTPGSSAECIWSAGFNNRFVNNVVATCRNTVQEIVSGPGFKFIVPPAPYTAVRPRFRGADMTKSTETLEIVPQNLPILEFRGNEVYGVAADGLTIWNLGTDGYSLRPATMGETVIKDLRVWHTYESAIWNYPVNRVTIDGLVYRVDPAVSTWGPAITSGDYRDLDLTVRGGSIHAGSVLSLTIDPLGDFRFENIDAVTRNHAFNFQTPATPGSGASRAGTSGITMVLSNNIVRPWPGQPLKTIAMIHDLTTWSKVQPYETYEVFIENYQGQSNNNFRAYFPVQGSTSAYYGGSAPCTNTTTRPEIAGITCATGGSAPAPPSGQVPAAPSNLRITP